MNNVEKNYIIRIKCSRERYLRIMNALNHLEDEYEMDKSAVAGHILYKSLEVACESVADYIERLKENNEW